MSQTANSKTEFELLDEEAFSAPDRLSPDDCLDQLGTDWRWSSAPVSPEDEG